jgi:hypothetical protein
MLRLTADPYAFDPAGRQAMHQQMQQTLRQMERSQPVGYEPHVIWDLVW